MLGLGQKVPAKYPFGPHRVRFMGSKKHHLEQKKFSRQMCFWPVFGSHFGQFQWELGPNGPVWEVLGGPKSVFRGQNTFGAT